MAFSWTAIYNDGELLHQIDRITGAEYSSESIDRKRLSSLVLSGNDGLPILVQHFESGQRMIYRRRIEQTLDGSKAVCHLIGWQMTVDGRNIQHVTLVPEDGSKIVMGGKWREDHRWLYPIQAVKADEIEVE